MAKSKEQLIHHLSFVLNLQLPRSDDALLGGLTGSETGRISECEALSGGLIGSEIGRTSECDAPLGAGGLTGTETGNISECDAPPAGLTGSETGRISECDAPPGGLTGSEMGRILEWGAPTKGFIGSETGRILECDDDGCSIEAWLKNMSGDKKRREAKAKKEIGTQEKEAIVVCISYLFV